MKFMSGGSLSAPYYTFSDEKGPIDIATYEFGAGENYRFTAVDGFNPHNFNIGAMPGITSLYVTGDPLSAVGDELTLSIPSDYSTVANTLYFYCVTHSSTMNGQLNVVEAAPTPESLAGTKYRWKTFETLGDGTEIQTPWDEARYTQTHVERWDHTASALISDPYTYTKTGPNTATVLIQ
jgi:hypothetical protein